MISRIVVLCDGDKVKLQDDYEVLTLHMNGDKTWIKIDTKIFCDKMFIIGNSIGETSDNPKCYGKWESGQYCDLTVVEREDVNCCIFSYFNKKGNKIEILVYYDL